MFEEIKAGEGKYIFQGQEGSKWWSWDDQCTVYKASGGSIVHTFQKDTISFVGKESRNRVFIK